MTPYASLSVSLISGQWSPHGDITVHLGETLATSCRATKRFVLADLGDWDDVLQFASLAFLAAADQLSEDGWEVVHSAECTHADVAVADA